MSTENTVPPSKEWKVRRVGTTTFAISKPKRSRRKLRQMRLKNRRRAR
ncbi:MAG: hypothetical protein HYS61_06475 [Acidobacteria bacterium]|nr:hypothetical protein [Acidobacteriota bacterium]